jgi:hypothetical protein
MGLLLRAFQANAVGYDEGMRWLGLDRRRPIGDADVAGLAWALNVDADDLRRRLVVLEWRGGGRWVHLAGQRLSRWIAPTCMTAKLCPLCLRESGLARMVWMTRAAPACSRHGYSLLQKCESCGKPIRWARPGVSICRCGRFYKAVAVPEAVQPELQPWLKWAEAVIEGDALSADDAAKELPALTRSMSLDGAYRLIEAFGLLDAPADPVREVRHSSASLRTGGAVIARGLRRLGSAASADDVDGLPFDLVHLPTVRELADTPACEADGLRAAWLLDVYRAAHPSGIRRVGARPKRQLPLFL